MEVLFSSFLSHTSRLLSFYSCLFALSMGKDYLHGHRNSLLEYESLREISRRKDTSRYTLMRNLKRDIHFLYETLEYFKYSEQYVTEAMRFCS